LLPLCGHETTLTLLVVGVLEQDDQGYEIKENEMDGACGTYGGEEECLQNFERKNYRSVHVVMLNVAVMHPVVHDCMYHKVFSPFSTGYRTCAVCLRLCAVYFAYMRLPSGYQPV